MNRRIFISILPLVFSARAFAQRNAHISTLDPLVRSFTGGKDVMPGKVKLLLPRVADNGHAVPMTVTVESPMTPRDHVRGIHLISEKNPVRDMCSFYFGPHLARAEFTTHLRLNGSQRVVAIAELSDGSFWSDMVQIEVREAACTEE